jgi:hypothetical protein
MSKRKIDVETLVSGVDPGTTPVDVVTGVGPSTAIKLHSANIKTAEQLSKCMAEQLVPLGIPKGTADNLIRNAVQILMTPKAIVALRAAQPQQAAQPSEPTPSGYSEEDIENANLCNMQIEDYLAMSPSGRARVIRIARMQVNVLPEDTDEDFAQDTDLGDYKAREFLRKQRKKDQEEARLQKIRQSAAVTEFVEREVPGHELKDEPINVHGQRLMQVEGEAEGAPIDEIVIRKPKRKKTTKRGSDIVQQIVDNILD